MMRGKSLLALTAMLALGGFPAAAQPTLRTAWRDGYRPTPARRDTELEREIAEYNAEVDRRKAEKRAAKYASKRAQP